MARKDQTADPIVKPARAKRVVHGAAGLAKAALGLDKADGNLMMRRWAVCDSCKHAEKIGGIVQTCGICRCMLRAKIRLAGETCPTGQW